MQHPKLESNIMTRTDETDPLIYAGKVYRTVPYRVGYLWHTVLYYRCRIRHTGAIVIGGIVARGISRGAKMMTT
jgi:hypothetical protein